MRHIARNARVAFQGEPGAFSQMAARKLLGNEIETVACPSFESLFAAIEEGRVEYILAPLENTLAGPVLRCYDLLYQSNLTMTGEVVLRINHCLIGVPGSKLEDIRRVFSHPVALAQCERFFATHPQVFRAATEDTAGSVRYIMDLDDSTQAAIAGEFAASHYGAQILATGIEDDPHNFTRFALLEPTPVSSTERAALVDPEADATTLVLTVANRSGALFYALEPFAQNNCDLMSLVSRPLIGTPWQYRFFLEVAVPSTDPRLQKALTELAHHTAELRLFGSYRSGKENAEK